MNYTDELLKLPLVKDARAILPRNDKFKWGERDPAKLQGLCLHQALEDTGSAMGTAKYDCGPNHISAEGLPGLSYTGFIEKNGILWLAWNVEAKTWSQGDADIPGDENEEYMAVCFGGNFSGQGYQGTQEPTPEQVATAHWLWEACQRIWGWKNNQLFGHYHFGKPACPGFTLTDLIETYNADKDWEDPKFNLSETEGRQQALKALNCYAGPIDGTWSLECRMALTQFQKQAGLNPDGVWGPKTNAAVVVALG